MSRRPSAAEEAWTRGWLVAVASGKGTMSQRRLATVERKGGGIEVAKAVAAALNVHLLRCTDDRGTVLLAASRHPFEVIA